MTNPKINLIIDSGAYSAYTKKVPISIDSYADFALKNIQHVGAVVNLDVINPNNVDLAASSSFENFLYLKEKRNLLTMPVFHSGESIKWLDKMIEETNYIGLSASMVSVAEGIQWYNVIWPHVTDNKGYPVAKFHAFGDAAPEPLSQYPWYSADSTTWYIAAGLAGRIWVNGKNTQFRTNSAKMENYIASDDSGVKREVWDAEFIEAGLDPKLCIETEMRESDKMLIRTYMNAVHFLRVQEQTRNCQAFSGSPSILLSKKYPTGGTPRGCGFFTNNPIKLHFVITSSTATRALAVIAQLGITNLLISFFYTEEKQWEELILPFIYDPITTCKNNPKLKKQCEILSQFLLRPVVV